MSETTFLMSNELLLVNKSSKLHPLRIILTSFDQVETKLLSLISLSHKNICLVSLLSSIQIIRWYCRIICIWVRYRGNSRSTSLKTPTLHAFFGTPRNARMARKCILSAESYWRYPVTGPLQSDTLVTQELQRREYTL